MVGLWFGKYRPPEPRQTLQIACKSGPRGALAKAKRTPGPPNPVNSDSKWASGLGCGSAAVAEP
eukprot:4648874-Heterocapsa_arctica.AAC.1